MSAAAQSLPVPGDLLLDRYRVEDTIARSGTSTVLRARELATKKAVAIKMLLPGAASNVAATARFVDETNATMKLSSVHVVKVLEAGAMASGLLFIVMDLLEGSDLGALVERRGSLPIAEAVDYVIQAADAVGEAHANGLAHRDLKLANLFLTSGAGRGGAENIIKVLDFGVSNAIGEGSGYRSPRYLAPEQVDGSDTVDARVDIWSLGVILYELLTGKPPFDAEDDGRLRLAITSREPAPVRARRPNVPEPLESVLERCLAKDREGRFSTLPELVRALAPFGSPDGAARAARIGGGETAAAHAAAHPPSSRRGAAAASPERGRSDPFLSAPSQHLIETVPSSSRIAIGPASKTPSVSGAQRRRASSHPSTTMISAFVALIAVGLLGAVLIALALRGRTLAGTDAAVTTASAVATTSSVTLGFAPLASVAASVPPSTKTSPNDASSPAPRPTPLPAARPAPPTILEKRK